MEIGAAPGLQFQLLLRFRGDVTSRRGSDREPVSMSCRMRRAGACSGATWQRAEGSRDTRRARILLRQGIPGQDDGERQPVRHERDGRGPPDLPVRDAASRHERRERSRDERAGRGPGTSVRQSSRRRRHRFVPPGCRRPWLSPGGPHTRSTRGAGLGASLASSCSNNFEGPGACRFRIRLDAHYTGCRDHAVET
jgi:hypothetical protein